MQNCKTQTLGVVSRQISHVWNNQNSFKKKIPNFPCHSLIVNRCLHLRQELVTAADIRPKCQINKRQSFSTFSRLLAAAGLQATDVQQTWIEAAALGAQQPLPAAASTGCALPDLLQKGNQGKPLTDCSLLHLRWCLQQQPRPTSCPATEQRKCRQSRQAPTPPQCSDAKLLCCRSRLLGSDNKYFEAESAVGSWSTLRLRGKTA